MINILFQSIFAPLRVFNRKFDMKKFQTSLVTVIITALLNTFIAPIVFAYIYRTKYEIHLDMGSMFFGLIVSIVTWFVVCTLFWIFSRIYNKGIGFGQIASTWGLSYIANFFCIILYNLLLIKPDIYSGSELLTFIISSFFIMLLIWKSIYYFMLMRLVLDTTLREIIIITVVSALVFTILMLIGSKVGVQIPML